MKLAQILQLYILHFCLLIAVAQNDSQPLSPKTSVLLHCKMLVPSVGPLGSAINTPA